MGSADYESVVAALRHPSAYPHPAAAPIRHLHTHISDVFLAGHYAYKLKKPVDFGFLDFTTLEKRRQACEEEVRLNRRLAPRIYLGVLPVCGGNRRYRVRDHCRSGETIADYVVRMIRLPQSGLLDRLADEGKLRREHLRQAAQQIADFHARAERGPTIDAYGSVTSTAARIDQNFTQTQDYIGITISGERYSRLVAAFARFLADNAELFQRRIVQGRIVDGHGDLHLRNMCWHKDEIVIFDCIEFNPAFRCGDVMNDVAFLTMDLDARDLSTLATYFLNEYLEHTQDYDGLTLLDFYQAYRAYVRGKVNSLSLDSESEPGRREAIRREAERYFALAERYFSPRTPGILITSGLSGSGKTTAARLAAELMHGIIVRSDAVRKHLAGLEVKQRSPAPYGGGIYATDMTERTYAGMLQHASDIVATGRWAILDATYSKRAQRRIISQYAHEHQLPFGILHCTASIPELERRLQRREARANDISDAGVEILHEQTRVFETPDESEGVIIRWDGYEDLASSLAAVSPTSRDKAVFDEPNP